jgi:hypothetical protein
MSEGWRMPVPRGRGQGLEWWAFVLVIVLVIVLRAWCLVLGPSLVLGPLGPSLVLSPSMVRDPSLVRGLGRKLLVGESVGCQPFGPRTEDQGRTMDQARTKAQAPSTKDQLELVPQSDERVHSRGAGCGQPRREHGSDGKHRGRARERHRVAGREAVEAARDQASRSR